MRLGLRALCCAVVALISAVGGGAAAGEPAETSAAGRGAVPTVTAVHHTVRDEGLRLELEVAPEPAFTVFTLADPDRLVIDLPALDWRAGALPQAIPHIAGLRHGLFRPDRARIVLDLERPLAVERAFAEPPRGGAPGRLVVDLVPVARDVFDARAGAPERARWQARPGQPPEQPAEPAEGRVVVAIDPGHGGIDPGAQIDGLTEKTLVLDFSRRLAAALEAMPGFRPFLTRDEDVFVPLAVRVARARGAGAHLMISVHADVLEAGRARGVSAYTLSEQGTDDAAEALAARENRADVLAGADLAGEGDDVTRLLVELAQRGTGAESAKLARAVLEAVSAETTVLRTRPHRQANFRVLKAPDMPSLLLELGFLDDPEDRARLTDPAALDETARAVASGIARWAGQASPGFLAPR